MRRYLLARHLRHYGCYVLEKGDYHEQWLNPKSGQSAAVPLAPATNDDLAEIICKQLQIPVPSVLTRRSSSLRVSASRQRTPRTVGGSPAASFSRRRADAATPLPGSSLERARPAAPARTRG